MTHAVLDRDMLMPRPPQGMGPGLMLALFVHLFLVIAIAFSVRWRASEPAGVEAELWSSVPQIAAPRPVEPEPQPQPQPVVKPEPPPPPPVVKTEPEPDAQIAIEKAKREEAERLRKKEEADKLAAEKRRHEEELAEKHRKEEAEKVAKEQEQKRLAAVEKDRKKYLERMMAQAGATGEPTSTGTAQRTSGPSATYAGRIKARVKPNIVFMDNPEGNPVAEVELKLAPDGTILSQKLTKSSGLKEWDDAVQRAIDRTQVLPRDVDGRVPSSMVIAFRPRD